MQNIFSRFTLEGAVVRCTRYGSGHINETYLLETDAPHAYILQRINDRIFPDVAGLMRNIAAVTAHLRTKTDDPRRVLTLVPTVSGESYCTMQNSGSWRVYEFVTGSLCLNAPQSDEDLFQSGAAFGTFQNQLADFPAATLTEILPRFHDTPARLAQLKTAASENRAGLLHTVSEELAFFLAREEEAGELMALCRSGALPLRVTHNDTKLNNVMLDAKTRAPLCVIDLDTVMPGLVANDFGDSIRFGASTAAEDETDLTKVSMSLSRFEAYAAGFLSACRERLTPLEIQTLPLGAKLMTLECGSRFLADYLNGNIYFRVLRPAHNLDRARTQIRLVESMEAQWTKMQEIVAKHAAR